MRAAVGKVLAWIAILNITFTMPTPAMAQTVTTTVDTCRTMNDNDVRLKINELASTSLKTELSNIDYAALVESHWAKSNVSARIDHEVDAAIEAIRSDSSWLDRAYSTVSRSAATRFATAVAERAYNSPGFKAALDDMATGVAKEAGTQIVNATSRVATPVINCVQTALQSRYGNAIAQVFAQESQKNLEASGDAAPIKVGSGELAMNSAGSITGIVLVISRRVVARVVLGVGRRIASEVATRVVSSIAGLVGVLLIAKDIYEAGEGVFPIIADKMKADDTKKLIKDEAIKSIRNEMSTQTTEIAQETAERIFTLWLDFKQKYNRLLALSEKNPEFAAFLKDRRFDQLDRLGRLVDLVSSTEGQDKLNNRLADGSLNKALVDLPEAGLNIALEQKSLDQGMRWYELAGRNLDKVWDFGLYRWLTPNKLTQDKLHKILTLDDKVSIDKLAMLDEVGRDVLLNLSAEQIRTFTRRLTNDEVAAFAFYEEKLDPAAAKRLLRAAIDDPSIMRELSGKILRDGILESKDQMAALDIMLRQQAGILGYNYIWSDFKQAQDGRVTFKVFWERYWLSLTVSLLVFFILLAWIRRLILGRTVIVVQSPKNGRG